MAVYGSQFVEGKIQEVRYSATTSTLFWFARIGGVEVKPTTTTIGIYNSAGTQLDSATFGLCTIEDEAWLEFTAMTSAFNLGYTLTNASAGFSATIRDINYTSATAGQMFLINITGTLTSGVTVVDDGDTPGSGKTTDTFYAPVYYANVSTTSSSFPVGEDYRMSVTWTYASRTYVDHVYFDVVNYPMAPMTTNRMIDDAHPDWQSMRPKEWRTWSPVIHAGHAELCRRIRALGNRPAFIVKREELMPYEMAFIEAEIAKNFLSFQDESRKYWIDHAEDVWSSRGEFAYAQARNDELIDTDPIVFSSRLTR